jgi:hypothetical protein
MEVAAYPVEENSRWAASRMAAREPAVRAVAETARGGEVFTGVDLVDGSLLTSRPGRRAMAEQSSR